MSNKLRNRLVGFITLLLVIIIVAPYVLTDKSNDKVATTIPLLNSDVNIEQAQDSDLLLPLLQDFARNSIDNASETEIIPLSAPSTNNSDTSTLIPDDKTFTIQLVALKNKQKIEELVALLRLNNYEVRTDPKDPLADQVIRLYVGPYITQKQAEMVVIDLNNLTKLTGIIIKN